MTKYAYMTNAELLRDWHTLDPIYLLAELVARMESALDAHPELENYRLHGDTI